MGALYCLTHVRTEVVAFDFATEELRQLLDPRADPLFELFRDSGSDPGFHDTEALIAETQARLAQASDDLLGRFVESVMTSAEPRSEAVLSKMERPGENVWRFCVRGHGERDLLVGAEVVVVQWLLSQALPARFHPPYLARVLVHGFPIHPDAREFRFAEAADAVQKLMDSVDDHPMRAFFPELGKAYDGMDDIVFRIEALGDDNDTYGVHLPAHLTGDLPPNHTWDA